MGGEQKAKSIENEAGFKWNITLYVMLYTLYPIFCIIYLAGCATLEQKSSISSPEAKGGVSEANSLPQSFQLHDVPHNPGRQKGTDCAPDSLRMVLNYRGKNISSDSEIPQKLTKDSTGLRGPGGGTSFSQMQKITVTAYKLPAFLIPNCDLDSIKAFIVNKWPPIISYRVTGSSYHAVVAVGYDDKRRNILVHDPNFQGVRKIRYFDLGGISENSVRRIPCLLVLPEGSTESDLRRGLEKYVSKELVSKLSIYSMMPPQD